LLTGGAELFAEHALAAGRRFGVSVLAVGLVLAGAEPEELITAIIASVRHHPGIAAGDAIGANVTMLTLILGLAALARPLRFDSRVRTYALGASAAGIAAAAALLGGTIGRVGGTALVGAYAVAVGIIWWRERKPPAFGEAAELEELEERTQQPRPEQIPSRRRDTRAALLVVAGVVAMAGGWLAGGGRGRTNRVGAGLGRVGGGPHLRGAGDDR